MGGGNRCNAWSLRRRKWFVMTRGRFFSGARVAGSFASRLYAIRGQTDLHRKLMD